MLSGSGWRPSEEVKDALPEVGAGGPRREPVGAQRRAPWARGEPVWGVWIKAAGPWRIQAWLVGWQSRELAL